MRRLRVRIFKAKQNSFIIQMKISKANVLTMVMTLTQIHLIL